MVGRLLFLLVFLPSLIFSAEFTASVSRNQMNVGENFTFHLTLKEGSAKETPSVEPLRNLFSVKSYKQQHSTYMINGKIGSNTTWKFTLSPLNEGEWTIPSMSIQTSEGMLWSQPITIHVVNSPINSDLPKFQDIKIKTEVSSKSPYKNEPVIYTVRIESKKELANIQMQKMTLENAVVETHGEPKISHQIVDGISVGVIEFEHLITPLKAESIKIPAVAIQALVPVKRRVQNRFFDDDLDPFSMMQSFDRYKTITLATEEVILDVQPPIPEVTPWIAAKALKIEEIWNESQSIQMGEPIIRGFKINGEGIQSSQLPSLNDLQTSDNRFKVYADKPELIDEGKHGIVKSYRKEQYTIIPQQEGEVTLPEISIIWWDVGKRKKAIAHIPSRTVQVLPASTIATKNKVFANIVDLPLANPSIEPGSIQRDPILYGLIAGLAFLLTVAVVWVILLQKKIFQMTASVTNKKAVLHTMKSEPKEKPPSKKQEKLPDLNPT